MHFAMLFRPVVQRHVKRNAQDATVAGCSVVPPRHATGYGGGRMASAPERELALSCAGKDIARKISLMVKRKILFLLEI
jgi:hypothetical protein